MVAYVVLANFTEQGIRNAKDSPKRAEAFKANDEGWTHQSRLIEKYLAQTG